MGYWEVAEKFLAFEPAKYGCVGPGRYRDEVFIEDGVSKYQLWNTIIAEFDGKLLTLRTEGWDTTLTFSRINSILDAARLNMRAGTVRRFPILVKNSLVYPFLDDVGVSMDGTITLPGGKEKDVEQLNQEMRQATYRIKAKAVHILAEKGYDAAQRYVKRVTAIAERSGKRMRELWSLYHSACDDVVRYEDLVITVLWLDDPTSSVRDRSRFIIAAKTSHTAEPVIYMEKILRQEAVGGISRIVSGNAEPVDPAPILAQLIKRSEENDLRAIKFLASINANTTIKTKTWLLASII